jgi:amino acid transporter
VNFLGSSETGAVGNVITVIKVIVIGIFIISGLWFAIRSGFVENFSKLEPVFPGELVDAASKGLPNEIKNAFLPIFIAMGFTFIAFEGYEIIVQTGEEVENPNTSIPKAIFYSLLIVVPIYFFVGLSALTAITPEDPATPTWQFLGELGEIGLAEAARQFMPLGVTLMLFGGLVSTLSALNATIYSSARVAFVMGRDRLLPKAFNEVNAWRRTPHWAIFVSGIIMIFVAIFLPLKDVAASADLLFVLLFLQVDISILRLRRKYEGKLFYGYQVPLFPYIPILAILAQIGLGVALVVHFPIALTGAAIWLIFGALLYLGYIRSHLDEDIVDAFAAYMREPSNIEKYGDGEMDSGNPLEENP